MFEIPKPKEQIRTPEGLRSQAPQTAPPALVYPKPIANGKRLPSSDWECAAYNAANLRSCLYNNGYTVVMHSQK